MSQSITYLQSLDVASAFASGVPVQGGRTSVGTGRILNFQLVLTLDLQPLPILVPYPRLAIFDLKGQQLLSSTFVPGAAQWDLEYPTAGRLAWSISGDSSGFSSITSRQQTELQWRILGRFGGALEVTIAQGRLDYLLADEVVPTPPVDPTESGLTARNVGTTTLYGGCPVARVPGGMVAASALSPSVRRADGILLSRTVLPGADGAYRIEGPVQELDWTPVTGAPALIPDALYYLGVSPGLLTTVLPSYPASALLQLIGRAVDTQTLNSIIGTYELDL